MDDPEKTTPQPGKSIVDSTMVHPDGDQAKLEPCLVILSGKDHGQSFRLIRTRNSFGRGKDVEIVLTDPMMSRSHGTLLVDGDRIELIDFGSSNGTFLDGERIAVTQSMGIKSARDLGCTMLDAMIHDADAALYRAKQGGRNRMVNADVVSVGH
jgi:pSer/pThr/pTyr-binding forkhead associated (FHA) protein